MRDPVYASVLPAKAGTALGGGPPRVLRALNQCRGHTPEKHTALHHARHTALLVVLLQQRPAQRTLNLLAANASATLPGAAQAHAGGPQLHAGGRTGGESATLEERTPYAARRTPLLSVL